MAAEHQAIQTGTEQPQPTQSGTEQVPPGDGTTSPAQDGGRGTGVAVRQPAEGGIADELVTTGWTLHHPGWLNSQSGATFHPERQEECLFVTGWVPNAGACLSTWKGTLPQEASKKGWLWTFEKTGVGNEYRIRPVPKDRNGTVLYATAPDAPGHEFWFPGKVCLSPRREDESQIWTIISSDSDPYAIAILPKKHPGYFLEGNWWPAVSGWPYLKQGSPASAHLWKVRRVSSL